jgi:4-amino-4-deoxychorismate lyase
MNVQTSVLVDGVSTDCFPVDDRGLMYGDGVFRTLRVTDGVPRWWDDQLAKLTEDCGRIGIVAPDAACWQMDLAQISSGMTDGVLKLVVTRGSSTRGYLPPQPASQRRLMRYDALSPRQPTAEGLTVRICALRLARQPRLAGIKHLNRLENVLARAEWNAPEIHEGLLLDQSERVISGVMSNLFIWSRNRLVTPRLDQCGVAGVARARLMCQARAQGMEVKEAELSLQDVFDADEVMLTNSVAGLRRVAQLESKSWPVGMVSYHLSALLDA